MTKVPRGALVLMAAALLVLSSCGHRPLYTFTRQGEVDLSGADTLQGAFSTTQLSPSNATDPHGCQSSVRARPYPNFGYSPKITINGKVFRLALSLPETDDGIGTHSGDAQIRVGENIYNDPSSTVTLRADGSGSVGVHNALDLNATAGGPAVTGTVRWSCHNGAVRS